MGKDVAGVWVLEDLAVMALALTFAGHATSYHLIVDQSGFSFLGCGRDYVTHILYRFHPTAEAYLRSDPFSSTDL